MAEEQSQQKRQVAYKISLKEVLTSKFVKEEGWTPNYIVLEDNTQVSRVNIVAIVVESTESSAQWSSIRVDDGSATMTIRAFENKDLLNNWNVGDIVTVIGRIREYNGQRYIQPEIVKRMEQAEWLELRRAELQKLRKAPAMEVYHAEEEIVADDPDIIKVIRELDKGDGASIQDVVQRLPKIQAEKMIDHLIKIGEVFESRPGRVKVLE